MSRCQSVVRPLARHLSRPQQPCLLRSFTTSASRPADIVKEPQQQATSSSTASTAAGAGAPTPSSLDMDPDSVLPEFEAMLMKSGKMPIGSRRRRIAMRSIPDNMPFEQLPYQAFQEARKILAADREVKIQSIREELAKISHLEAKNPLEIKGGQEMKDTKLASLRRHVEELKILADINDPVVKKRFEDGVGDMNKPIYRYYAEKRWRSYNHRLITQRIKQFHIVPDIIPKLEPTADVQLHFRHQKIPPGQIVDSLVSEKPPRLRVQVFDKGERLVSVVVMDADVPDIESDGFIKRCHYLATNIPLSPTQNSLALSRIPSTSSSSSSLSSSDLGELIVPWLPAFSQKGAPYHRLAIFLLEHAPGQRLDVSKLRDLYSASKREGFSLKSFRDKFSLKPFGFTMFRTVWDENTASVMARHDLPGADVEFRPTRVRSLKEPVKARGWEAKHMGPKYRHLDKYTKRIRGVSNKKGWVKKR